MAKIQLEFNNAFLDDLREFQALLGTHDLKSTVNLLATIGKYVVKEASSGGQVAIVNIEKDEWTVIRHPALDNIKAIREEK